MSLPESSPLPSRFSFLFLFSSLSPRPSHSLLPNLLQENRHITQIDPKPFAHLDALPIALAATTTAARSSPRGALETRGALPAVIEPAAVAVVEVIRAGFRLTWVPSGSAERRGAGVG